MSVSPRALLQLGISAIVIVAVIVVWLSLLFPRYWLFDLDAPPKPASMAQK